MLELVKIYQLVQTPLFIHKESCAERKRFFIARKGVARHSICMPTFFTTTFTHCWTKSAIQQRQLAALASLLTVTQIFSHNICARRTRRGERRLSQQPATYPPLRDNCSSRAPFLKDDALEGGKSHAGWPHFSFWGGRATFCLQPERT